ncbi:MAG: hypothetical protein LBS65_09795 [Desulfovibrio sp.]|jgi:hypothetical protein|nr:hypothetical protein [Desulfovibrio sp.]
MSLSAIVAEEQKERELFASILEMSRQEDCPLRDLFALTLRLANPGCAEDEVLEKTRLYEGYLANPPNGADELGNPRWISLTVDDERMRQDAAGRQDMASGIRASDGVFRRRQGVWGILKGLLRRSGGQARRTVQHLIPSCIQTRLNASRQRF